MPICPVEIENAAHHNHFDTNALWRRAEKGLKGRWPWDKIRFTGGREYGCEPMFIPALTVGSIAAEDPCRSAYNSRRSTLSKEEENRFSREGLSIPSIPIIPTVSQWQRKSRDAGKRTFGSTTTPINSNKRSSKYLGWIYSKNLGKSVLDSIVAYTKQWYHNKLSIEESDRPSYYDDANRKIFYNLSYQVSEPTYTQLDVRKALPVYLYHELVHAYRSSEGTYEKNDPRQTDGGFCQDSKKSILRPVYSSTPITPIRRMPSGNRQVLPRRPCYLTLGPSLEDEIKRRYFLMLPIIGYNSYEFISSPENAFTGKINMGHFTQYVAQHYNQERTQWPQGFPRDLKPDDAKRQHGYGLPVKSPKARATE